MVEPVEPLLSSSLRLTAGISPARPPTTRESLLVEPVAPLFSSSRRTPGSLLHAYQRRARACRDSWVALGCRGVGVHPVPPRQAFSAPQAPPRSLPTPDHTLTGCTPTPLRTCVWYRVERYSLVEPRGVDSSSSFDEIPNPPLDS